MALRPAARYASSPKPATPPPEPPKKETKAVAVKEGTAVSTDVVPDFMKGYKGQGVENITANDIETPRIKLLQGVSEEIKIFDNAKPGEFWHSVAEMSLGPNPRIVPIYVDLRAILWRPRHEGGGILARADDGQHWVPPNAEFEVRPYKDNKKVVKWRTKPLVAASGLLDWGSTDPEDPNSAPAATRMYNIAVALPDFPELGVAVVTLQRSGIRVARKFMGKLKLMSVPSFGTYFTMGITEDSNPSGDSFYNYTFTQAGLVQTIEEFTMYRELYEKFKEMGLQIRDLESAQSDVIEGEATTSGGDRATPDY